MVRNRLVNHNSSTHSPWSYLRTVGKPVQPKTRTIVRTCGVGNGIRHAHDGQGKGRAIRCHDNSLFTNISQSTLEIFLADIGTPKYLKASSVPKTNAIHEEGDVSRPESTPWAGPAIGDHCWPQANPWPGFLNSAES
uniref:Late blight resistance protein n=1 Tax=Solanum tuberosum TaxID=4113 RepID=M1DPV7_SOLTU